MAETIVLDPSEVATARTAIDITPWVASDGIDWGDAEIAAYMAEQSRGSSPVDYRVPNRTVTIPLALKTVGGTSFATARTNVQAKAALFQQEGGWLKRVTASGGTVFADIVNATYKLGGGWMQAFKNVDTDASLVLETLPDFYGAEVTLSDHVTTTASELIFTETGIQGDYPARCRIVVDEDDGDAQLGLMWAFRSKNYDSAATAKLIYTAGTLTPQDTATTVGGTAVLHSGVLSNWTPVLSTDIIPSGAMTHVGSYRVWVAGSCSVASTNPNIDLRLLWDVGDLSTPVENPSVRLPGMGREYLLDLGEVRIDRSPSGTHRWKGQIQARTTSAAGTTPVYLNKLWIAPTDEGYGVLRAPITAPTAFSSIAARDSFEQTAGNLTGKTAPIGGVWIGAGDATDFVLNTANAVLERTAVSDANTLALGRFAVSGASAFAAQFVRVDLKTDTLTGNQALGVLARYTDTNNWARFVVTNISSCYVDKYVAGVNSMLAITNFTPALVVHGWVTLELAIDTTGRFYAWVYPKGAARPLAPTLSGQDSALASGGALASGKPGIYDAQTAATAAGRFYDDLLSYSPTFDAVLNPSQSAELRWDGMFREDAAGVAYGPVPDPGRDLPRLPPAGLEARTCEVLIKGSRGDFDQLPNPVADDISARIFYRPCRLFVT